MNYRLWRNFSPFLASYANKDVNQILSHTSFWELKFNLFVTDYKSL